MTPLAGARTLARSGVLVGPGHFRLPDGRCSCKRRTCQRPGRHPRHLDGHFAKTADTAELRHIWQLTPSSPPVAWPGETSGVWILDSDDPEALDALLRRFALDMDPPTVRTGRGHHLYFEWDPRLPTGGLADALGPGLDYRGPDSYVMAPPTRHTGGTHYTWQIPPARGGFPRAPEELIQAVISP
ncbi:hypothetical protein CKO28_08940 [Rhodovibrio sodomensis]|uniref:DNA primase/polymerase bifunctional N-terminal domain-containing protein n=1 Tax=Rhodovibrio sodomensis TaxID=1088 RepID=A0ABS1DCH6_9PROT|nr:bifunctional DNA primase/polymerase [Rhodovibrio sodomensis]MBK1668161.1 hypothetical protein [Rhodovibrio sodomensis]